MKKILYILLFVSFTGFGQSNSICETTTSDALGPYFLEGSPYTESIVADNYEGELFFLSGTLLNNCEIPISNAVLEFWQTDENGDYDYDGYRYRGKIITDSLGNYNLETILPGKYLGGSQYRPSHIHLMILVDGTNELATQIYFEGDTDIPTDYLASSPAAVNRIIPLYAGFAGDWFGTFDIVLSIENYTINGCTNPIASNYNSEATIDDGSCISIVQQLIESFDAWNLSINLESGWNMFGYGCPSPIDLEEALSNHFNKIVIVKDYLGNTYLPEWNFNGIGNLNPGLGYQIKLSEAIEDFSLCDWYVNDIPEDHIISMQDYIVQLEDSLEILNQPSYEVGDETEGGIVFYVDSTGQHGLVLAIQDIEGTYEWGCFDEDVEGADGQAIGTGYQNTLDILNQGCTTENGDISATQAVLGLESEGYNDWYLPSMIELLEIYNTLIDAPITSHTEANLILLNLNNSSYWTSSEGGSQQSWYLDLSNSAFITGYDKSQSCSIRPIRSF